jgi:hypothetical protein
MSGNPKRCSVAKAWDPRQYCRCHPVNLHLRDTVGYRGISYLVEGIVDYHLEGTALRLARLHGAGEVRHLEISGSDLDDRVLLFAEIALLDITAPPPATIYHGGESYLLKLSGTAEVAIAGSVPGCAPGGCTLWRYRAAGGRFLQIEAWPNTVRMLEGASVHRSMIEIRPATLGTHKE